MPPKWPRLEIELPGLDLEVALRETSLEMQKRMPPKLELAIRENHVRKARIRLDGGRVRVEDVGDAYGLFDSADWAGVDFVEFEAFRLDYLDRFERRLQEAVDRARRAEPNAEPQPRHGGAR